MKLNDDLSESYFDLQIDDVNSRYFGGVIFQATGIPSPSHTGTGSVIGSWVSAYVNRDSRFFHLDALAERLDAALDYMLRQQHEDGTISPGWTNYNSPPDTGFIVTGFAQIYHLLNKDNGRKAQDLTDKVKTFLHRTIPAMLTGGCHTPNHRWVMTSALCHLHAIFGNDELLDQAEAWLAEGIDITADGEWTERSNGIYNSVSNIFMYHIARLRKKPELLNYIRKNLNMMQYLIHPDGEVVTEYSGRQDYGHALDLAPYHLICSLMAHHDCDPIYGAMAAMAAENLKDMGPVNNHIMIGYLLFPFIKEQEYTNRALPVEYEVLFNADFPVSDNLQKIKYVGHGSIIEHSSMHESFGAPVVRYRKDNESVTLMSRNESFFSLRKGSAKLLGVKLYSSFSPGIIELETIEKTDGAYHLRKVIEKGYRGPIPNQYLSSTEQTSIWYLLPHQHRELTHNQKFEVDIAIKRTDNDTWKIHLKTDEREDVLMQVEFLFSNDGQLVGKEVSEIDDSAYFWKGSELIFNSGDSRLVMKGGGHEHWMEYIGVFDEVKNVTSVKVNLVSPVDKWFVISVT